MVFLFSVTRPSWQLLNLVPIPPSLSPFLLSSLITVHFATFLFNKDLLNVCHVMSTQKNKAE